MIRKLFNKILSDKLFYLDILITISSNIIIFYLAVSENKILLILTPFIILRFAYVLNSYIVKKETKHHTSPQILPAFSIIICAYNETAENLSLVLKSIFDSTVQPIEVILIDDGSTMPVVIDDIWDTRVRLIRNSDNIGLRRSQIIGIRAAKPVDYILIIDSDINFEKTSIEKSLSFISLHPDGNIFGVQITIKDFKTDYLNTFINSSYHGNYYKRLFESRFGSTLTCNGAFMFCKYAFLSSVTGDFDNETFLGDKLLTGNDKSITNMALKTGKSYTIPNVSITHEKFVFKAYTKKIQRTFKTSIIYQIRAIFLAGVSPWVRLFSTLDVISFFLSVPLQILFLITLLQLKFFYVYAVVYLIALTIRNNKPIAEVLKYNAYRFFMGIYFYLLKIKTLVQIKSIGWGNR